MKVSIVTIGDEILIGQIVDTNSAWIAQRLNEIGLQVNKIYSIPDTEDAIIRTLDRACKLTDIVLVTGGLGPTNDEHGEPPRHSQCNRKSTSEIIMVRSMVACKHQLQRW